MHFNLSLGRAFGGTVVAKPIMLWLDPFLRTTLADLIVWPNRIVVPLSYDPDFDYSILEMRCGVLDGSYGIANAANVICTGVIMRVWTRVFLIA